MSTTGRCSQMWCMVALCLFAAGKKVEGLFACGLAVAVVTGALLFG